MSAIDAKRTEELDQSNLKIGSGKEKGAGVIRAFFMWILNA
jgi:hypothetical protein